MTNKNYKNGAKKEYKIIKQLGYSLREPTPGKIAIRSAGSHGVVDLALINTKVRVIRLIQCKPDSMSDNAKKKIVEENKALNGPFHVIFEVV